MKLEMKPTNKIITRLQIQPGGKVHKYFTHRCRVHMEKYVPRRDENLRRDVTEETDKIIYNAPYAHYQYIGILYVDPETGSSYARKGVKKIPTSKNLHYTVGGSHWDKKMWSAEKEKVEEEVTNYMKKIGGKNAS